MVTRRGYIPERGDVVRIAWNDKAGHDPEGRGVALVLSLAIYNGKVGLALLCPITDRVKGYPFEVPIPGNMKVTGSVLSDELKSLDWKALKAELICRLPDTTVSEVLRKAATLLSK
jgi:mRNA interferase MazF